MAENRSNITSAVWDNHHSVKYIGTIFFLINQMILRNVYMFKNVYVTWQRSIRRETETNREPSGVGCQVSTATSFFAGIA